MTFGKGEKKKSDEREKQVVCSRPLASASATSPLLSAVCLNLPAAVFTPQGDRVIRPPPPPTHPTLSSLPTSLPPLVCHPAAALQRRTAGAGNEKNNINSQEATSNVHHLAAPALSYRRSPPCRNQTGLMCFSVPASLCAAHEGGSFLPTFNIMELYLYMFVFVTSSFLHPSMVRSPRPSLTVTAAYSAKDKKSCCSQSTVTVSFIRPL